MFRLFKIAFLFTIILLSPLDSKETILYATTTEKIELNLWEFSAKEELMNEIIGRYESKNPHIKINLQILSYDYGFDKILTSIAADNPPDICELGTTWIEQFADGHAITDLTDDVTELKEHYFLWETATYQNKVYGIPWLAGTRIMFYNRNLFRKAGLDPNRPPQTWKELENTVRKIHNLGNEISGFGLFAGEPYSPWQQFMPFAWGNGGKILNENSTESVLNSKENIEALEFYNGLKKYSAIDRQEQINNLFANGKIGIQFSGFWNIRLISRLNPSLDYGLALLPKPSHTKGEHTSFAGGQVFTIFEKSKHKKEALDFIKFLISEENTMLIVKDQKSVVPTYKKSINHPYYDEHPRQKIFFEQIMTSVGPPKHKLWPSIQEILTHAIEKIILMDENPKKTLDDAVLAINGILEQSTKSTPINDRFIFMAIIAVILAILSALFLTKPFRATSDNTSLIGKDITVPVFLSPWVATFLIFSLYPLIHSIIVSFSNYDILHSKISFIGLDNYLTVFQDPDFYKAVWHTIIFALGTIPFTMSLALFAAIIINHSLRFKGFFQAGLFLPVTTSVIVIASVFTYIYSPRGPANLILENLNLAHPQGNWLNHPASFVGISIPLLSIMLMNIWASFGYYTIFFIAGLQSIPKSLYEATAIDGANAWQQFLTITIPHLKPILLLAFIINTINTFQVFPEIFTMTRGGPLGNTTTIVYHLYNVGFHKFRMGEASAIAYILFAIIMFFSFLQFKIFGTKNKAA